MKRKLFFALAVLIVSALCLGGCSYADYFVTSIDDEVMASLGRYEKREYYTSGGFQDYTDYAKYKYNDIELEGNPYLKPVTEENLTEFKGYLENFEGWIETISESDPNNEVVLCYDFSASLINEEDYLFVDNRASSEDEEFLGSPYTNYNLYFFDTKSSTLYYFHNNI